MAFSKMSTYCNKSTSTAGPKWIWVFPEIVVRQNGWFIREKPIKMDDLGVPRFLETPIFFWGEKWKRPSF